MNVSNEILFERCVKKNPKKVFDIVITAQHSKAQKLKTPINSLAQIVFVN